MEDINPQDILNDFTSGKIDLSSTVRNLLSISLDSKDEALRIQVVDILLEIYRESEVKLKKYIEETVGKKFVSKYNIVPREAMGLGLLRL